MMPTHKTSPASLPLPKEAFAVGDWEYEGLPYLLFLNTALETFEYKDHFGWHLCVIIDFEDVIENGMPSVEELELVNAFGDTLDAHIKAEDNALLVAKATWNATRQ